MADEDHGDHEQTNAKHGLLLVFNGTVAIGIGVHHVSRRSGMLISGLQVLCEPVGKLRIRRGKVGHMKGDESDVQHVVAAVVVNGAAQVLLAQRPLDRHQGGLWEFPGGKVEPGEAPRAALARELYEELGITVKDARPLIKVRHDYPDKSVLLDVWRVTSFAGEAHGREGQAIAWLEPRELPCLDFPAANRPIVTAARLPAIYLVTPEPHNRVQFLNRLEGLLDSGIQLLQLRAKSLAPTAYADLAKRVAALCSQTGARLLLNAPPSLVTEAGAAGVHLTAARLMALTERPLAERQWVAASCHNEKELAHARRIGVDFVVVAPVLATASHPTAQRLGWQGLRNLTDQADLPVYALGGMTFAHLTTAWDHGAQGIAAISALWGDPDIKSSLQHIDPN
jgi:8-oxo-dGTP diphosphatase